VHIVLSTQKVIFVFMDLTKLIGANEIGDDHPIRIVKFSEAVDFLTEIQKINVMNKPPKGMDYVFDKEGYKEFVEVNDKDYLPSTFFIKKLMVIINAVFGESNLEYDPQISTTERFRFLSPLKRFSAFTDLTRDHIENYPEQVLNLEENRLYKGVRRRESERGDRLRMYAGRDPGEFKPFWAMERSRKIPVALVMGKVGADEERKKRLAEETNEQHNRRIKQVRLLLQKYGDMFLMLKTQFGPDLDKPEKQTDIQKEIFLYLVNAGKDYTKFSQKELKITRATERDPDMPEITKTINEFVNHIFIEKDEIENRLKYIAKNAKREEIRYIGRVLESFQGIEKSDLVFPATVLSSLFKLRELCYQIPILNSILTDKTRLKTQAFLDNMQESSMKMMVLLGNISKSSFLKRLYAFDSNWEEKEDEEDPRKVLRRRKQIEIEEEEEEEEEGEDEILVLYDDEQLSDLLMKTKTDLLTFTEQSTVFIEDMKNFRQRLIQTAHITEKLNIPKGLSKKEENRLHEIFFSEEPS